MSMIGDATKTMDIDCGDADPVSIAFTCDGKQIVSGERHSDGSGGRFRQFHIGENMGKNAKLIADIKDGFDHGAVSNDGQWIVYITGKKVVVRNTVTNEVVEVGEQESRVHAMDVSPDSTRFALALEDKTVRVFCINTGKSLLSPLQHDKGIFGVKFSPLGTQLATTTFGGAVWLWNARTGVGPGFPYLQSSKVYAPTVNVTRHFTPVGWSANCQRIFTVFSDEISALDLGYLDNRHPWYPTSIPASSDPVFCSLATNGRFVACAAGGSLSFWDATSTYTQIGSTIIFQDLILCIALSHDDSYLACGRGDKKITVYALRNILPLHFFFDPTSRIPLVHSAGDVEFRRWMRTTLLPDWLMHQYIDDEADCHPKHHALANSALVEARSGRWSSTIQYANESLSVQPSVIGHIAKARGLLGEGKQELAFEAFDLAFRDCNANETKCLLLIKAIFLFISGKQEYAIARVNDLIAVADDSAKYDYLQVLANMHLMQGNTVLTMQSFERARSLLFFHRGFLLVTILLIFGRSFEELDLIVQRPLRSLTA